MLNEKSYKSGDKITIWENDEEKMGSSIVLTYFEPNFEDADLLYSFFQNAIQEYERKSNSFLPRKDEKHMTEEEKNLAQLCFSGAVMLMKTNIETRNVWQKCMSKCVINGDLFPMGIQLPENAPFLDKIRILILGICIARFTSFSKPHNG